MTTGDDKLLLANPPVVRSSTTCYQLLSVHINIIILSQRFFLEVFMPMPTFIGDNLFLKRLNNCVQILCI
jgi:hypothetical protein